MHGIEEIQAAAKLMYYGGDLAEALLAITLLVRSRPAPQYFHSANINRRNPTVTWKKVVS